MVKVVVLRPTADDQRVVGEPLGTAWRSKVELLPVEVESDDLPQDDPGVPLPVEENPQWVADLCRAERARRDLVRQGLEQVEVPLINQRHLHVRVMKVERRLQAAEAATHDDHPMRICLLGRAVAHPSPPTSHLRSNLASPRSRAREATPSKKLKQLQHVTSCPR